MKVLAVTARGWPGDGPVGGAETMLADLLNGLTGVQVEATTTYFNPGNRRRQHGNVDFRPARHHQDLVDCVRGADVVISHLTATGKAYQLARTTRKKFVQIIHNDYPRTKQEVRYGDLRIFNSWWLQRAFKHYPGMVVHPPALAPIGVSGNPGGAITLVNLCDNKGPDVFYGLASRMPHRHFMGVSGGYLLQRQQIRTDLANVEMHPFVHDVSEIYKKTAILIVPSFYESYGRVAVEAMSCGIPVVASNTPGLKESVGSGGIILPRDQPEMWVESLEAIFRDYETFSVRSRIRFNVLCEQSIEEMKEWQAAVTSL